MRWTRRGETRRNGDKKTRRGATRRGAKSWQGKGENKKIEMVDF